MDPGVKIAAACGVMLVGLLTAVLFRQAAPPAGPLAVEDGGRLVLRKHLHQPANDASAGAPERPTAPPVSAPAAPPAVRPTPTVLKPQDRSEAPPALARDYPPTDLSPSSPWGTSIGLTLPGAAAADETLRTHTIVDGDTLASLAERYLGARDREGEIYEANREVLSSPQVLPIGVELEIPPRAGRPKPAPELSADETLVPVAPAEAGQ